ncbi:hypothetical protein J6P59_01850 [bacterium]|nr:hypothetical protein [bacterium]
MLGTTIAIHAHAKLAIDTSKYAKNNFVNLVLLTNLNLFFHCKEFLINKTK